MKNAFSRMGRTCASVLFGGVLGAGAMFAAPGQAITVTLPYAVTAGSTTLPSGVYTMSEVKLGSGNEYFIVRGENGQTVTLRAQRVDSADHAKTQVVFSKDGDTWHFDKLFVDNDGAGFEFSK